MFIFNKVSQDTKNQIKDQIFAFKMMLLRKCPFYGDILMRFEIFEDENIPTACTDGHCIRYNPYFFSQKTIPEQRFIVMHEVFHALLLHPTRIGNRDPELWNVACDFMVNSMLEYQINEFKRNGIEISEPSDALRTNAYYARQNGVELMYNTLVNLNKGRHPGGAIFFPRNEGRDPQELVRINVPSDILAATHLTPQERATIEDSIKKLLEKVSSDYKGGSGSGSFTIPQALVVRAESKKLPWKKLLRDFLEDGDYEDTSYFTPERKYLHMDLIIPGPGDRKEELGETWAFVDSSGSITKEEMGEFLTQLYRILKEFSGTMNVAFWNTNVDGVYKNITEYKEIDKVVPKSTGGTDLNCVYDYMEKNRIKPSAVLILTDGYFGCPIKETYLKKSLVRKTIMVLTQNSTDDMDTMKKIGKVAKL